MPISSLLGLALLAAPIGLHLDAVEGLTASEGDQLVDAVRSAVRRRSGQDVALHEGAAGECGADRAMCLEQIRASLGCDAVVIMRAYAAVTTVGLYVELHLPQRAAQKRNVNLRGSPLDRAAAIAAVVDELLVAWPQPVPRRSPPPALPLRAVSSEPPPPVEINAVAATAFGIGVAAAAASAAVFFWARADEQALDDALNTRDVHGRINGISIDDAAEQLDSINERRNIAAGFGGGALAGLLTGAIALIVQATQSDDALDVAALPTSASVTVRF